MPNSKYLIDVIGIDFDIGIDFWHWISKTLYLLSWFELSKE